MKLNPKDTITKLLLLVGLFFATSLMVIVATSVDRPDHEPATSSSAADEYLAQESFYAPVEIEDNIQILEEDPEELEEVEEEGTPSHNEGGDVLGVGNCFAGAISNTSPTGCVADTIGYQPVCAQINANVGIDPSTGTDNGNGTVTISQNSLVEIWKVTAPTAILSGINDPKDNTYSIRVGNPVFRSANHFLPEDGVAAAVATPGEERSNIGEIYTDADTGDFGVHVSPAMGGSEIGTDTTVVRDELASKCVDIQPADPNPDATNKAAQRMVEAYSTPGSPIEARDYDTGECLFVDPGDVDLPRSTVFETCHLTRSAFDSFRSISINVGQWFECQNDPSKCQDVELVGIVIDAPFGSNHKCEDGYCADQFFDHTVAEKMSPADVGVQPDGVYNDVALEPHYVTTPCQVRIDYSAIYGVPCLWDISPYWADFQNQAATKLPGDPDFLTWDEYWAGVEAEAEKRATQCTI